MDRTDYVKEVYKYWDLLSFSVQHVDQRPAGRAALKRFNKSNPCFLYATENNLFMNAQDIPLRRDRNGKVRKGASVGCKTYYAGTLPDLEKLIEKTPEKNKTYYEMCMQRPCNAYFDVEWPGEDNEEMVLQIGRMIVHMLHHVTRIEKEKISVTLCTTKRTYQASYHIFVHTQGYRFLNQYHVGDFARCLENSLIIAFGAPEQNPFFFRKESKNRKEALYVSVVDLCVYTMNRVFRLMGQGKENKPGKKELCVELNARLSDEMGTGTVLCVRANDDFSHEKDFKGVLLWDMGNGEAPRSQSHLTKHRDPALARPDILKLLGIKATSFGEEECSSSSSSSSTVRSYVHPDSPCVTLANAPLIQQHIERVYSEMCRSCGAQSKDGKEKISIPIDKYSYSMYRDMFIVSTKSGRCLIKQSHSTGSGDSSKFHRNNHVFFLVKGGRIAQMCHSNICKERVKAFWSREDEELKEYVLRTVKAEIEKTPLVPVKETLSAFMKLAHEQAKKNQGEAGE